MHLCHQLNLRFPSADIFCRCQRRMQIDHDVPLVQSYLIGWVNPATAVDGYRHNRHSSFEGKKKAASFEG